MSISATTTQTLTVAEAARLLGIGRGLAYEAARRGDIPALRIGRRFVVPRVALERLLAEAKGAAARLSDPPPHRDLPEMTNLDLERKAFRIDEQPASAGL